MNRRDRIADFQSRIGFSPDSVVTHSVRGWRYIPIHPFTDEPKLLAHLGLTPADCVRADAYWEVDGDIVFLETIVAAITDRRAGLYCRTRTEGGNNAYAVLRCDSVARSDFEQTMIQFYDSGRLLESFPEVLTEIENEHNG